MIAGSGFDVGRQCRRRRGEVVEEAVLRALHRLGLGERDALEVHGVAGLELAELPQLRLHDGRRADKAAEAGAIGAEQDGHVAGEVDGADGVGVVVNVGGMQARLAAIGPRPLGLGSDQPHAGAIALVVHLPVGREEHLDIFFGEEIGRGMRSEEHTDLPGARQLGHEVLQAEATGLRAGPACLCSVEEMKHIAGAQSASRGAAEAAQHEGAAAAEIGLRVDAAAQRKVGANALLRGCAEREHAAGLHLDRRPARRRPCR